MKTLYKKEMLQYLYSPTGLIVIVVFALMANFIFVKDIFAQQSASMRPFFIFTAWLFSVLVPALCMRSFAGEKQNNTIETLLTIPLHERQIVLAKFFSVLTMVALSLLLTMGLPLSLSSIAGLWIPEVLVGYIGLLLIAGLYTSISLIVSLKSESQVVAFFVAAVILFLISSFSSDFVSSFIPRVVADFLSSFAPFSYLDVLIKGVIDIRSLVYFGTTVPFFLFISTKELQKRK